MTTVQIDLPDRLAQEARRAGLLEREAAERMVREALRAERIDALKRARTQLAADSLPAMTPEEIQAEIDAYRAESRRAAGS